MLEGCTHALLFCAGSVSAWHRQRASDKVGDKVKLVVGEFAARTASGLFMRIEKGQERDENVDYG
jgi:hypothetical protein